MAKTTISIEPGTKERLSALGRHGQSWDELLNELAAEIEDGRE